MRRMGRHDDEVAIFQVVEAIFVAVLVATALIFFALVQKPTPSAAGPGIDLGRLAGDALGILQGDDPGDDTTDGLEEDVEVLYGTGNGDGDALRDEVAAVLPEGLRFMLRTTKLASGDTEGACIYDSTAGTTQCRIYGPSLTAADPRNAQGAVTYVKDGTTLVLVELVVWNAF